MPAGQPFSVPVKGIGKPDYSRAVSSGVERAGLYLQHNHQRKMFSWAWNHADAAYPFLPDTGLVAGGEDHLRDSDTFIPTPYTLAKGFALTVLAVGFTVNQDIYIQAYIDSILCTNFGIGVNGAAVYENRLWDLSTLWYDPTAASEHIIDLKVYNEGGGTLYGGVGFWVLLEAIGTPWPTTKDCMCPYCNHLQTVSVEDARITCENCGKVYLVTTFSSLKRKQLP